MSVLFEGRTWSEEAAMRHVLDIEEVMEVMNRRVFYLIEGKHREELADLWVREPEHRATASFGRDYGYYDGWQEIERYYVTEYEKKRREILTEFAAENPSIKVCEENLGIGFTCMNPNSTPLVEIAGDGQTAQGVWYSIAQETTGRAGGRSEAIWRGEKLAADFIREAEGWKIWHLVIATDYVNPAGTPHEAQPLEYGPGEDPREIEFGTPTISKLTHDSRLHWADNYPPEPAPYEHWSEAIGYGPKGRRTAIQRPADAISPERIAAAQRKREELRKRPPRMGTPGGPKAPEHQQEEVN